jgi:hypothetical protein
MKKVHILAGAILATGLWQAAAFGQAPAAPAPAAAAAAGDPAAAAAAKPTFCERLDKACDKCRRKICATPLGGMLNSITKPLSIATGGIIPNFCPIKPSDDDLKKPGAEGAAAQAMKDAVEASARRKAVRLLGTFDCHWYPEAEAGLAAALRTDRAECVRLEAAIALNRGCCCTRLIVEALEDCVGGTDKLGPSENSPRVQAIACMALERCLGCPDAIAIEEVPQTINEHREERREEAPRRLDEPGGSKPVGPGTQLTPQNNPSFGPSAKGSGKPSRALLEHARQTLAMAQARVERNAAASAPSIPNGQRSVSGLVNYVIYGGQPQSQTSMPPVAPSAATQAIARTTVPQTAQRPAPMVNRAPTADVPVQVSTAPSGANITPFNPVQVPVQVPVSVPTPTTQVKPMATKVEPSRPAIDPTILHCLETLRDAQDPETRHAAVRTLAASNWHEHPEAIAGLVYAARYDHHAGMRVAAIRSLVTMKAGTPEVISGLKPLVADPDEWIRHEATLAITALQTVAASHTVDATH